MKKKYFPLFICILITSFCFSQTKEKKVANTIKNTENITTVSDSKSLSGTSNTAESSTALEKNPLPQNGKTRPAEFYIIDDKPVDYETYIKYLQNKKNKK